MMRGKGTHWRLETHASFDPDLLHNYPKTSAPLAERHLKQSVTGKTPVFPTVNTQRRFQRYQSRFHATLNSRLTRRRILQLSAVGATSSLAGCSTIVSNEDAERLIELYENGYTNFEEGASIHNEAVIAYQDDEYDEVQEKMDSALPILERALVSFGDAKPLAVKLQNRDAERIVEAAIEKSKVLIQASKLLRATAKEFGNENYDTAQNKYDEYRETAQVLTQKEIVPPQMLEERVDTGLFDF